LTTYVLTKLQVRITVGSTRYCRLKRAHWVYRCGITVEPGDQLAERCTVEALLRRDRPNVFRIVWKAESVTCRLTRRAS
jgi:hypothetical protein